MEEGNASWHTTVFCVRAGHIKYVRQYIVEVQILPTETSNITADGVCPNPPKSLRIKSICQ
jgi:hypothetical protein